MKAILSIKPEFVEKIIKGEKKYEYRRKIFKKDVESVIIYASSPIKKVIGEFIVEDILSYELDLLWKLTHNRAGVSRDYFYKYFKNTQRGYAIKIKKVIHYDAPLDLKAFGMLFPPQSYVYYGHT